MLCTQTGTGAHSLSKNCMYLTQSIGALARIMVLQLELQVCIYIYIYIY